jgi:hypothetical protein
MAFTRNTAPPALQVSWKPFDGGDSIILSITRFAAFMELFQMLVTGTREYNASHSLKLTQFSGNIDEDLNEFTAAGALEYRIDVDPTTGDQSRIYENPLEDYIPWVTPTTGELIGKKSPQAAFTYMVRQLNRLNDSITPGRLFNDPRGLVTLEDSDTGSTENFTAAGLPVVSAISATGAPIFTLLEYGVISDLQHNVL